MKQHHWRGETYVNFALPEVLMSIAGARGDMYLWAPDARTLVCASEEWIKELIDGKVSGTKRTVPDYAAGWKLVSRDLFAVALDNRGGRILNRTMTEAELKEALADPKMPEYHLAGFYQNVAMVVAGFGGNDDFRLDLRASADTAETAAQLVRNSEGFVGAMKGVAGEKPATEAPANAEAAGLDFIQKVAEHASVRREGSVVTIHAEAASGFNQLLSIVAKEMVDKKGED
jgi:hypothetical protein